MINITFLRLEKRDIYVNENTIGYLVELITIKLFSEKIPLDMIDKEKDQYTQITDRKM